jgi:hypothetical protein
MKRSKSAKWSRKAAKKKRTKPDDTETATMFAPAAIPKPVESPRPAAPEPKPVILAPDQSKYVASSSRSEAARRTTEGRFTKAVFHPLVSVPQEFKRQLFVLGLQRIPKVFILRARSVHGGPWNPRVVF